MRVTKRTQPLVTTLTVRSGRDMEYKPDVYLGVPSTTSTDDLRHSGCIIGQDELPTSNVMG